MQNLLLLYYGRRYPRYCARADTITRTSHITTDAIATDNDTIDRCCTRYRADCYNNSNIKY